MPTLDLIAGLTIDAPIKELIEAAPMPGLGDGPTCDATRSRIDMSLKGSSLQGTLGEAGLWLLAGDLNQSHEISQSDASSDGSFWHGIMHRREGDFWNSKYWFRKVQRHPVHEMLSQEVATSKSGLTVPTAGLIGATTIAESLVDRVEQAVRDKPEWVDSLQKISWWEWQLLFAHCVIEPGV